MKIKRYTLTHIKALQTKIEERKVAVRAETSKRVLELQNEAMAVITKDLGNPKALQKGLEAVNAALEAAVGVEQDLNRASAFVEQYKQKVLNDKTTAMRLKVGGNI